MYPPVERKMEMNLTGRNFLTLIDYTPEEIRYLLDLSKNLKYIGYSVVKGIKKHE